MNSEEQVAVLQQIFPQQGPEPHLRSSYSERPFDVGLTTALPRNVPSPLAKVEFIEHRLCPAVPLCT